eukprot:CAMPEP_0172092184 /NCGR_PEP_ID=MMETSP1043-20130122/25307_1 /TAXON_ID=464988 /ORGANISM="Hemiselmis andersenii, Strain CCMP441" /LENGTH=118 /DNA_ID=CAMNT_0012754889 /DNA_START=70 /DNA_END=423 /DNA_ORIENTATION=+
MPPVKDEEEQTHHKRPREEDGDEGKDVKSEPKKPKGTWEESGEEGHMVISQGRNQKRVTVSKFKGIVLVGLREYYEKDNKWLPGRNVAKALFVASADALQYHPTPFFNLQPGSSVRFV